MSDLLYVYCRNCGERLIHRRTPWCSDCNLHLAYLSMPLILGSLLLQWPFAPQLAPQSAKPHFGRYLKRGYDSENALNWE